MRELLWGSSAGIVLPLACLDTPPDIIIGADVVLWPNHTKALLVTVKHLLRKKPLTAVCYISYVVRAHSVTELLLASAAAMGLVITEIPTDDFLPIDTTPEYLLNIQKRFFEIRLLLVPNDDTDAEVEEARDMEFLSFADAPC